MAVNTVTTAAGASVGPMPKKESTEKTDAARSEKVAKAGAAQAYAKAATQKPTVSGAANVQISEKAREMSLAKKVAEETPDVREDKVAFYKNMIANGQYKPDANKITEGLLKEAIKDELSKDPEIALG